MKHRSLGKRAHHCGSDEPAPEALFAGAIEAGSGRGLELLPPADPMGVRRGFITEPLTQMVTKTFWIHRKKLRSTVGGIVPIA